MINGLTPMILDVDMWRPIITQLSVVVEKVFPINKIPDESSFTGHLNVFSYYFSLG
ncbi:MAG: hypothetical protein J1F10_07825 [Muribaculaceae bacterium]|nr:hypothetical protein [Muribaculaceae bacterium]